jgi:hypothetical protein
MQSLARAVDYDTSTSPRITVAVLVVPLEDIA